jgi:chromosome segregation ATPase
MNTEESIIKAAEILTRIGQSTVPAVTVRDLLAIADRLASETSEWAQMRGAVNAKDGEIATLTDALRTIARDASAALVWAVDGNGHPETAKRAVKALAASHAQQTDDIRTAHATIRTMHEEAKAKDAEIARLTAEVEHVKRAVRFEAVDRLHSMLDRVLASLGIDSPHDHYSNDEPAILAAITALKSERDAAVREVAAMHADNSALCDTIAALRSEADRGRGAVALAERLTSIFHTAAQRDAILDAENYLNRAHFNNGPIALRIVREFLADHFAGEASR